MTKINIHKKTKKTVKFSEIDVGQTFKYCTNYYIKLANIHGHYTSSLCLDTWNTSSTFIDGDIVIPVDSEINIYE